MTLTKEDTKTSVRVSSETLQRLKTEKVRYMASNKLSRLSDNEFLEHVLKRVNKK